MAQKRQVIFPELPMHVAAVHANRDLRKYKHVRFSQIADLLFDVDGNFAAESSQVL
jgi:hypothetical protein